MGFYDLEFEEPQPAPPRGGGFNFSVAGEAAVETLGNIGPGIAKMFGVDMPQYADYRAFGEAREKDPKTIEERTKFDLDIALESQEEFKKEQAENPWSTFAGRVAGTAAPGLMAAPFAPSGLMGAAAVAALDGGAGSVATAISEDPELAVDSAWANFGAGAALGAAFSAAPTLTGKALKTVTPSLSNSAPGSMGRRALNSVYKKLYSEVYEQNPLAEQIVLHSTPDEIGELVKGGNALAAKAAGKEGKAVVSAIDDFGAVRAKAMQDGLEAARALRDPALRNLDDVDRAIAGLRYRSPEAADALSRIVAAEKDPDAFRFVDQFLRRGKDPKHLADVAKRNAVYNPRFDKDVILFRPESNALREMFDGYGDLAAKMGMGEATRIGAAKAGFESIDEFAAKVATWQMLGGKTGLPGSARAAVYNLQAGLFSKGIAGAAAGQAAMGNIPGGVAIGVAGIALDTLANPTKALRLGATATNAFGGMGRVISKGLSTTASGSPSVLAASSALRRAAGTRLVLDGAPGFVRGKEGLHEAAMNRSKEVRDLLSDEALNRAAEGTTGIDSEFDEGVVMKQAQVSQYLQSKLDFESERISPAGERSTNEKVPRDQVETFARHWYAAMRPHEIPKLMAAGQLYPEHVQTLRELHPGLHRHIVREAAKVYAEKEDKMPYQAQLQFQTLLGEQIAGEDAPTNIQMNIANAAKQVNQARQQMAKTQRNIQHSQNFKPISAAIQAGELTW